MDNHARLQPGEPILQVLQIIRIIAGIVGTGLMVGEVDRHSYSLLGHYRHPGPDPG